jgi:hypothetical protein
VDLICELELVRLLVNAGLLGKESFLSQSYSDRIARDSCNEITSKLRLYN